MANLAVFVTDFADGGVVVPLCLAVALTLLLLRRARLAAMWSMVTLGVWTTMLLLKLAGYTMAQLAPDLREQTGLLTASGHVASAAFAYGALAGLLAASTATTVRRSFLTALCTALLIGFTRVSLREHSMAEAIVGGLVGIAGAYAFARLAREPLHMRARAVLLAAAAATLIVMHGEHYSLETSIAAASAHALQTLLPATPRL